jgi:hypothetical protein
MPLLYFFPTNETVKNILQYGVQNSHPALSTRRIVLYILLVLKKCDTATVELLLHDMVRMNIMGGNKMSKNLMKMC